MDTKVELSRFINSFYEFEKDEDGLYKRPVMTKHLKLDGSPIGTTKMKLTNNPRYVLEQVINEYQLQSPEAKKLSLKLNDNTTYLGLTGSEWLPDIFSPLIMAVASGQPIIVDGKTIRLKDDEESNKILQSLMKKSLEKGQPQLLGEFIEQARVVFGDEPFPSRLYIQLGLGALCIGGIAYVVHHARR